ncbi:RND family efflux transporter, MFP subunit [Burkholderiales bacterium JOSHI_001]|nr:RND family efflux transporter, MFP subunit [Burkholderiales bacterium JOSHI_001]
MRFPLRPTACLALSVALAALAADPKTAPPSPGASAAARPTLSVSLVSPRTADWPQLLAANGNVAAWQEAVLGAELGGLRLVEVNAAVGDRVRRGQLLARLASDTLKADADATRASLAEARALGDQAKADAERARSLRSDGMVSAQQLQSAITAEVSARARIDALRARVAADDVRLAQTRILASDDGVISARAATVGAVVQPGQELFRLIRKERLEWRAEVAASELARVKPGQTVTVTPAGGAPVRGVVRMVAPTVDGATRNGLVYVDLPAPGAARAGMFARGELELGRDSALTLPQTAVLLRDGFAYVFLVGANNKVAQVKVGVGRRVGDRVELTSGLQREARVVATGAGFLADGDTVRVVDAPPAATAAAAARSN